MLDQNALVVLGKALFWDMQSGSDGRTACATCHFHAGADHRVQNQLSGPDAAVNQITNTLDPKAQDGLWRKVATVTFEKHLAMPLYWLPAEVVVDPKIVGDYIFGGYNSGAFTHVYNIKAAR